MEPVAAVVREAVLHSFAAFAPAAGEHLDDDHPAVADLRLASARVAFADALAAALRAAHAAGLGDSEIAAAASAGCAAHAAVRSQIHARVSAATLHNNSEEGPEGPWVLLPLADDVLLHFVNKLHSDL